MSLVRAAGSILAEQVIDGGCTVGERQYLVVDAGPADVPLDQAGVPLIVLDHDDGDGIIHALRSLALAFQLIGSVTVKVLPWLSSEATDMVPPSRRTSARTCASPMPCPG